MISDEELRLELHKAITKSTDLELRLGITKTMLCEALRTISDLEDELEGDEELNEDGMPVFIDTSGHLSGEQRNALFKKLATLEENDKDLRDWLRDIELRIDDLVEIRGSKKKWWMRWKK